MKPIVALPFRNQAGLVCEEARNMLTEAGFELVCNEKGVRLPREDQKAMIENAFAIIAGTESYDADMLSACKNLKTIIRFGVGTDNFDLQAMREMGIQIGVITNHNAVAEFALTLILAALKNLTRYDASVREGKWIRFPMQELSGKTVGIVGFGRIGRRLAELLSGFGVEILGYDPYMDADAAAQRRVTPVTMAELLARSDVISLHLPATKETTHLINAETIGKMKDGICLVNTSRGALVDEVALYEAMVSGKLLCVGQDVFETEPVAEGNPLFALPNNVLAPHVAAATRETNYNGGIICAQSILNVANGGEVLYPLR